MKNPNSMPSEYEEKGDAKQPDELLQELWIVRDDRQNAQWIFTCKTLYDVKLSESVSREIERSIPIPYCNLWKYFGVDVDLCDRSDIKMFLSMLLDCMVLEMPTINMQRHQNEDQDFEEEVHIKIRPIEIICHARHIVDIERTKYPLTMSLIGCNEQYFGIKAVIYHRDLLKEEGVFLRVEASEWCNPKEVIDALPKHKKKDKLKYFYSLPKMLEDEGFEAIFHKLKFSQDKLPLIENYQHDLTSIEAFSKSWFEQPS